MAIPFRRRRRVPRSSAQPRPVRPNVGIQRAYQKKIDALIQDMTASALYWVRARYRSDPPRMASDAAPTDELKAAVDELTKRWQRKFDHGADDLAGWFAVEAAKRSDAALKSILRRAGFSVEFTMTPVMRDVLKATVEANVALIRSIPEHYFTQVEGAVMRSVQTGRDLAGLTRELTEQTGVTRRRAAFIALDQNNKATSALQKARQMDLGITEGVWLHSHGGREPRPTHLANSGKKFKIADGWYDPDPKVRKHIMPGELINCRCVWKPVIEGFS